MQIPKLPDDHFWKRFVAGDFLTCGVNLCLMCAHYQNNRKCVAFPEGIPQEIWILKVLHKKPYPGDKGITFKPLPAYDSSNEALGIK